MIQIKLFTKQKQTHRLQKLIILTAFVVVVVGVFLKTDSKLVEELTPPKPVIQWEPLLPSLCSLSPRSHPLLFKPCNQSCQGKAKHFLKGKEICREVPYHLG